MPRKPKSQGRIGAYDETSVASSTTTIGGDGVTAQLIRLDEDIGEMNYHLDVLSDQLSCVLDVPREGEVHVDQIVAERTEPASHMAKAIRQTQFNLESCTRKVKDLSARLDL